MKSNNETQVNDNWAAIGIGAMIVFARSSKEFDRKDTISENQNGMNLPLVTRGGFIRDCIFATEDVINVK